MAHHINAIVTKQTPALNGLTLQSLPQGFALLADNETNRAAVQDQDFAAIWTDYFGGFGEQGATLYQKSTTILPPAPQEEVELPTINQALHALGVIRESHQDEFDAINLGHFRDNDDIEGTNER